MELKDQVCSLESAKRLKELGVKQESLFYWDYAHVGIKEPFYFVTEEPFEKQCSAFTVAELFELLPPDTTTFKNTKGFRVGLPLTERIKFDDKLFVESAAKMLIYLLENKLI